MALCRLIYISRPAFPIRMGWLQGPLAEILAAGLRHNPDNGVTGILGVERNRFFQILEGGQAYLDTTFDRIRRDKRHFDVREVVLEEIPARAFSDWAVGFAMASALPSDAPHAPDFETMDAEQILARGRLLRDTGVVAERATTAYCRSG